MKNYTITVNGKSYEVSVEERGGASAPVTPVAAAPVAPVAKAAPATSGSEGRVKVVAPMSGKILGIKVSPNQAVKKGEVVAVLEAMKMQNSIEAEKDGKVTAIAVKVGQAVLEDDPLVVIE